MRKLFQVDAFTDQLFEGNPAAVCPLDEWLPSPLMQQIAAENNLAETAFFVPQGEDFSLKWFTPVAEVDLCGHATLASAHVLYHHLGYDRDQIKFDSNSGELLVKKKDYHYVLDFPSLAFAPVNDLSLLSHALGVAVKEAYKAVDDYMIVFDSEEQVISYTPNFNDIATLEARGVIITAKSEKVDFVSRFFGPRVGVNEDPVTGSAHTKLVPYWSDILGKDELVARQVSKRGGELHCRNLGDRVEISGKAITYFEGTINI
ncbi:MAG: PhzF family phenazine biosynthesis protein [Bacteroidota bacterium]